MHKFIHTDSKFSITWIHIHKLKNNCACIYLQLPEQKEVRDKERSAIKAREAFDELDLNKDGL